MKNITGGVCAAKGFMASGIHAGIRQNKNRLDLGLIYTKTKANAASCYTQNLVKGAPIAVTKANIADGYAKAIICNSGNANTCNADGEEIALKTCELLADELNIDKKDIVIASTGVIGLPLSITPFAKGMKELVKGLKNDNSSLCNQAIMTTDTKEKNVAIEFEIGGVTCKMGGICKGSGMIHPNMATMLVFITTDVSITTKMLQQALSNDVKDTFNMISVDGDTSTNDMVTVLANGEAHNKTIEIDNADYEEFAKALNYVTKTLCKLIAADGEGASKLLECNVYHSKTLVDAKLVAKSVITSSLFKAAMFGADANWGRVLCAIGYSNANVDIDKVNVSFKSVKGNINVCHNGRGVDFSEDLAKEILKEHDVVIDIDLCDGNYDATAWGCDLTYEYVKINGDYRS